ncbi:MAG: VOC family protein [Clostridia bacterium]|nr:VOC family protein [Clostridia bacterium]
MRIANIGILVKDLEGAKNFFHDYFGAEVLKTWNEPENGYYSYIMTVGNGAWLELMTKPSMVDQPKEPNRSGLVHVCFFASSREELDDIVAKLKADGYTIQYEPSNPTGAGEVRAIAFEDIIVEVNYTPGMCD